MAKFSTSTGEYDEINCLTSFCILLFTVSINFYRNYLPFQLIFIGIAPAGRNGDAYNYARMPRQSRTAG